VKLVVFDRQPEPGRLRIRLLRRGRRPNRRSLFATTIRANWAADARVEDSARRRSQPNYGSAHAESAYSSSQFSTS
jgi:hypothetical protein